MAVHPETSSHNTMSKEDKVREQKWEMESDVRTLIDAGKIKSDKARLKRAMGEARRQKKALDKVT